MTFALTYHSNARASPDKVPFEPRHLLPHPIPWAKVVRASFDGFYDQFRIRDDVVLKTLPNLRSLMFHRCDTSRLVRLITPADIRRLEILQFEDELSGADFGGALSRAFGLRLSSAEIRLKELKILTSGDLSSGITVEQMERLKEWVDHIQVEKAPGYRSAAPIKYN